MQLTGRISFLFCSTEDAAVVEIPYLGSMGPKRGPNLLHDGAKGTIMSVASTLPQSRPSHLYSKRSIYYFRFVLNNELRQYLNRTEIRISLRTSYIRAASHRAKQLYCLLKNTLKEAYMLTYNEKLQSAVETIDSPQLEPSDLTLMAN